MAIAEATLSEILQEVFDNDPVEVSTAVTATVALLPAKAGFRAAVIGAKIRSSGAANAIQFRYGTSPTDITGAFELDDTEEYVQTPHDLLIIMAPENEKLDLQVTQAAGNIEGFVNVGYVKVR